MRCMTLISSGISEALLVSTASDAKAMHSVTRKKTAFLFANEAASAPLKASPAPAVFLPPQDKLVSKYIYNRHKLMNLYYLK